MEVKIGIVNIARDLVIDVPQSAADVTSSLRAALASGELWSLTDEKGRKLLVPATQIGYVDLGAESSRPVGFGAV